MTIDDENSVYVGGLPYDSTEDSVRRVFDLYGQVVAVKIINDHGVGGKCYGFVTYTNPRSAVDAITDMDGRTIDGRVVKVNEVKTRGTKSNFGRDSFRRNNERVMDLGRGRERERNYDYERERSRDRNSERSRDPDQDRERGYDRASDLDQTRNRFIDRDRGRDQDRDMEDREYERERNRGQELGNDLNLDDREIRRTKNHQRSGNKDRDQTSKLVNSSNFSDRHSKEHPSGSSQGDYNQQVEEQLDFSNQKLAELQKQISDMTELAEERGHHLSKLEEKSLKLEDALTAAKNLTSHRQKQLMKLHKCYVTMKDYSGRLKSCEQELQSLVESTMTELAYGNDVDAEGILTNGET